MAASRAGMPSPVSADTGTPVKAAPALAALSIFGLELAREIKAARSSSGSRSILLRTSIRGLESESSSPRTFSTCAFCSAP